MRRRDHGTPIRTAMKHAGLDIKTLAAKTAQVDPEGRGVGKTLIGYMVGTGKSAREEHSDRACMLVAEALAEPVDRLFTQDAPSLATGSASTSRLQSQMSETAPLEPLVPVKVLCTVIDKSETWVWRQRRAYPIGHKTPFPVHYVGRTPKYRPTEVLAWNAQVYAPPVAA